MTFWIKKNKMESKQDFEEKIRKYYEDIARDQVAKNILDQIVSLVTEKIYEDYRRFWRQYPKSRKRYSVLKLSDLEHPFIHYAITEFLERSKETEIHPYSKILFKMSDGEYEAYLNQKEWYDTQ
jgi:hypothetical protein